MTSFLTFGYRKGPFPWRAQTCARDTVWDTRPHSVPSIPRHLCTLWSPLKLLCSSVTWEMFVEWQVSCDTSSFPILDPCGATTEPGNVPEAALWAVEKTLSGFVDDKR